MKKLVPFNKEIEFKTNIAEITSISLEHSLHFEDKNIRGNFIITGDYKMTDTSINTEPFEYNLPFEIDIDDRYDTTDSKIDIDDFYYEIVNNNTLKVNIDVLIDKLEEIDRCIEEEELPKKEIKEEVKEEIGEDVKEEKNLDNQKEDISYNEVINEKENSLFNTFDDNETYSTYHIYIVRENDTIESILNNYEITKDLLEQYNDIKEIKLGDKIIIPTNANN